MRAKWLHSVRVIAGFGGRHRRWLIRGSLAAVAVVGARLLLPWSLKAMIAPWLESGPITTGAKDALLWGGIFLAATLALGWADLKERLAFARYAIGLSRDVRAAAFQAVTRRRSRRSGDLVARLVGDTARMKAGLKGFLVHVATNGFYLACLVCLLLWIHPPLGLVFAGACVVLLVVTTIGATAIYRRASKYRHKEGKLAEVIRKAAERPNVAEDQSKVKRINKSSGKHEAALTRIQGRTTWCGHGVFGAGVILALWIAWLAVDSGALSTADLVLVAMYVLTLRAPTVQLARQGARTGKILASANRVVELIETKPEGEPRPLPTALHDRIRIAKVVVRSAESMGNKRLLGKLRLEITAGERVAVIGPSGSGKTLLLRTIAGFRRPRTGKVSWDGVSTRKLRDAGPPLLAFVGEAPVWPRRSLRRVMNLDANGKVSDVDRRLRECGLGRLLKRLPAGLETVVRSDQISMTERKAVSLCRALVSKSSVLLLDDPTGGMKRKRAGRLVETLLDLPRETTVIMSFSTPVHLDQFDRVIQLDQGRVVFDGTPNERAAARRVSSSSTER